MLGFVRLFSNLFPCPRFKRSFNCSLVQSNDSPLVIPFLNGAGTFMNFGICVPVTRLKEKVLHGMLLVGSGAQNGAIWPVSFFIQFTSIHQL